MVLVVRFWFLRESLRSFRLAWPTVLSFIFITSIGFVSLAFCGHIENSPLILEAVGLALSLIKISGIAVAFGIVSTLDTLSTQAWGAENYRKVGVYLQRGAILLSLVICLILGIWFNAETILNLFHQPPEVVKYSVQYIQIFSSALPAVFMYVLLQKYLQSQNIVYPFILTGIFANIVNAVAHYLFLFVAKWGIRGAAAAVASAWYANFFSLLIIIYVRKLHVKTWGGWSRESLKDWGQFARYSLFGLVMIIVKWISFEIGFFITGYIGNVSQAIHTLLCSFVYITFTIPNAISTTASIRVGNELGAGNHKGAKQAIFVILTLDAIWVVFITALIISLKDYIPMIFTSDLDVLQALGSIMYVAAAVIVMGNFQLILAGIIRGSGKQSSGAIANFVSFLLFSVPLCIVLVFVVHMGILGYWLGLLTGEVVQTLIYGVIILTIRWKKQAVRAQKMASGQEKLESHVHEKSPLIQDGDSHPTYDSNIEDREEVESSLVVSGHHGHQDRPPPVKLGCGTIVIRILTCSVFVVFLIGGVVLSQLCVYRCDVDVDVGNHSNVSNNSLSLFDFDSNYTCSWHFIESIR